MNGSIALVGSGEYLPQMMQLEQSLIDDGVKNGKQPVYVQIPTAAGQESSQRLDYWKNLGQAQADRLGITDRKSTRLNSSHSQQSRMPSSA